MGGQRQEWEKMACLQTQSELLGSRTNDYLVPQLGSCLGNSTEREEARGGEIRSEAGVSGCTAKNRHSCHIW